MRAHLLTRVADDSGNVLTPVSVDVFQPGTTDHITAPIYSDGSSASTLDNPLVVEGGVIDFYLATPQRVDLMVTYGTETPVTYSDIDVLEPVDPSSIAAVPASLQIILPGNAVVGTNVAPPGMLISQPIRIDTLYLAAGTAPSGGGNLSVRLHWTAGQAEVATNPTDNVGAGYLEIDLPSGSTSVQTAANQANDENNDPIDSGPYAFAAGTYLRVEVVAANGAADVSVAVSGSYSTF